MTPDVILLLLFGALGLYLAGGIAALLAPHAPRFATWAGAGSALAAALVGLSAVAAGLAINLPFQTVLHLPCGGFFFLHFGFDALSLFFIGLTLLMGFILPLYGVGYLGAHGPHRPVGGHWFCFNLLLAGLVLVFLARDAVGFLLAWEIMALASFGLVLHDHDNRRVRRAGWIYLVACHLGAAAVLLFFLLLAQERGGLTFALFQQFRPAAPAASGHLLFALAVLGFGSKAGFMPLHVWLPEAHPAAPSHVSALMSGIMIKAGLYGLLRALEWIGPWSPAWGWTMILIGLSSGLLGALSALANNDLKRALAYSSIDHIGILAIGFGLGILGVTHHLPALAAAGFAGTLLHLLNHALFKGLLFLSAGAVAQAAGTREISRLGGLFKTMPRTGLCFLIGAVALCAIPPLNGFFSEFLLYLAAFRGYLADPTGPLAPLLIAVIGGLALIGGLTVAAFTKAFGLTFLGEPRLPLDPTPRDPGPLQTVPLFVLCAGCFAIALGAAPVLTGLTPVIEHIAGASRSTIDLNLSLAALQRPLSLLSGLAAALMALGFALLLMRRRLLRRQPPATGVTWDCGYAAPSPRMQYTPSSFGQPLLDPFTPLLNRRLFARIPKALFPASSSLSTGTADLFQQKLFVPFLRSLGRCMDLLRWIQTGRVQIYILYIIIALVGVLLWSVTE